jgi:hypothetical protein
MAIIAAVRAPLGGILADDNGIRVVNLFRTRRLARNRLQRVGMGRGWTQSHRVDTGLPDDHGPVCRLAISSRGQGQCRWRGADNALRMQAAALEAGESHVGRHSGEPTSVVTDQPKRRSRTVRDWLLLAFVGVRIALTGLPAFLIVVLDALPLGGDWLTGHVPFWDEVTDF